MQNYEIVIANDHAGFEIKSKILVFLEKKGYKILDLGCHSTVSVDYPDYAQMLAKEMIGCNAKYGILICASGIGMSIAANRFSYIRAALCLNEFMAEKARAHNDANVLVLGSYLVDESQAAKIIDVFLTTEFERGRHVQRVEKL